MLSSRILKATLNFAWLVAGTLAATTAGADAGHDHGAAAPVAATSALPRFAATSELFELVGVLDGKQLTLYLDRFADNRPVPGARLELEVGGSKVAVKPSGEGEFTATLANEPKPGTTPVTATVLAGTESDLLAADLDIRAPAQAGPPAARSLQRIGAWAAAAALLLGALAWLVRRALAGRTPRFGGAA